MKIVSIGILTEIINIVKAKIYLLERYRYSKRVYSILEEYPDYIIYSHGLTVWHRALWDRLSPSGIVFSHKDRIFKRIYCFFYPHHLMAQIKIGISSIEIYPRGK